MADKNWTGNSNSIYKTLGASNHTYKEREVNDYYATDPIAGEWLLDLEKSHLSDNIWEPSCGEGHLSKVFKERMYKVKSTDLIDRGYGEGGVNFLKSTEKWNGDIITNPPYKFAKEFVEKALELVNNGRLVCMFLKIQFLEGKKRKELFLNNPPKRIWVSSSRITCAKNADFEAMKKGGGSAVAYAWFIWEKGFKGKTTIDWFN